MNRQDDINQYQNNYSRNILHIDKIEDILIIKDPDEMDNKINKNMGNVHKIFYSFLKKISYNVITISKEEIDNFIYTLKFVDTLNLFIQNQTLKTLLDYMKSIYDNAKKLSNNFEYKELILKKIKYTEMTVIFYKKRIFKNLYFGDGRILGKEIENNLEQVTRGGKFDQIIFKQMQNLFYVVQGRIEENKRIELQNKFSEMKNLSIKYKKQRLNQGNYFEDYDYSDYKNYSNVGNNLYDYNENFYDNRNYYEEDYNNNYYKDSSRRFHRHSYRNNTYNSNYYIKKYYEGEEKEFEGNYKNNKENNEDNDDKKNDNIEVIQNVVQGKNYYNNEYGRYRNLNNNSNPNLQQNINTGYNSNYRKGKKIQKQRGITLVEVPLPNSIIQNEENENNNNDNNNDNNNNEDNNNKDIVEQEENNVEKYQNKFYYNNSNYKQNSYNKGNYYNNYHHRDNYYYNNYYNSQNNLQSGNNSDSNSYYNNRRNKNYYQNMNKKRDFFEVNDLTKNKNKTEVKEEDNKIKTLSFNENNENNENIENNEDIKEIQNPENKENNEDIKEIHKIENIDNNNISNDIEIKTENLNDINKEQSKDEKTIENPKNENIEENDEKIEINIPKKINSTENNIEDNNNTENKNTEKIKEENSDIEYKILKPIPIEKINFNRNFLTPSPDTISAPRLDNSDDNLDNIHNQIDEEESLEDENSESEDSNINDEEIQQFNQFISESLVGSNKENYYLNTNKNNNIIFDENENFDDELINEINEKEIEDEIQEEIINNVINEDDEQETYEEKIEEFIKEKIALDSIIHLAQKEIIDEEEKKLNLKKDDNNNNGNIYTKAAKEVNAELLENIKNKLSADFKNKIVTPNFIYYPTGFPGGNTSMFDKDFLQKIIFYKQNFNNKIPLNNYIMNNMQFLIRGKDAILKKEYLSLKIEEFENPKIIWNNLNNFENKIIIPLYQRINYNVNKKRKIYHYTFNKYNKIIQKVLLKDKILKKVKPYGSYMNNFLIDYGDIDICIVPKCEIIEFGEYLEKIKEEIVSKNIAEHKLTHHTGRYLLLKLKDNQTNFIIDITVHTMLPILNTNLIRLYSLFDQRFHILGLYIKHWAKINKIHGAADNYLSSYALLLMLIHFLQKIVEPKILPNLQKIDFNQENIYEYYYNGESIKTNIYYEEDLNKIKAYMNKVNKGQENKESAVNLLVKFFEYYSYFFNSEQKISINKDLNESVKLNNDNIAFSIEDPFDKQHNPGKSMTINSIQYLKFVSAMKREVNFILNGEYVKRLEKIFNSGNLMNV